MIRVVRVFCTVCTVALLWLWGPFLLSRVVREVPEATDLDFRDVGYLLRNPDKYPMQGHPYRGDLSLEERGLPILGGGFCHPEYRGDLEYFRREGFGRGGFIFRYKASPYGRLWTSNSPCKDGEEIILSKSLVEGLYSAERMRDRCHGWRGIINSRCVAQGLTNF